MEARTEHPGAGALSPPDASPIAGIDLGTTNCALAWTTGRGPVAIFQIPQLVAPGEVAGLATLPSFLYFADEGQRDSGAVRLPWRDSPEIVAGLFAREEGALVPSRQIASAKSWLSNPRVDRTAPLLPWGTDSGPKLSPVQASSQLLVHLRDAWNHTHAEAGAALETRAVVVTVPASFDEEARELTAEAATAAGFREFTLLEEPLAALYAWIAAHRRELPAALGDGALILVCDVGGGTTDFSLIRARLEDGELAFERTAIGEHLLLGGDNLDLALAVLAEQKMAGARLTLMQRQILRRKCSAAKEQLLSDPSVERVAITLLGAGRGVVGGGLTTELSRAEVLDALKTFLPVGAAGDLPARDRRVGLRELGLPFETEPAITRHLAAFLTRSGRAEEGHGMARPDAVLFNGGFFTPAVAREQVLDALAGWFGVRPRVLVNERPESAVAIGAAFYGRLRRDPDAHKRLLIRAGSGHSYYIGVEAQAAAPAAAGIAAVSVMPRGTEEGTRYSLAREFTVVTNRPAAFTLYSATSRTDPLDALVTLSDDDAVTRHAPLVTALRFGKRSRSVPLAVRLSAAFTETGTLELWCESTTTDHRWRLAFNLRGLDADPLEESGAPADEGLDEAAIVVADETVTRGGDLIREVFGASASRPPEALVGELENVIGHGKPAWPLGVLRTLADILIELEAGRRRSAAHEVRWLNLTGFCLRPGFGSVKDGWRVSELRKVYAAGLAFPREIQNQVEWTVLWQRVGAGFSAGQQRELAQRTAGQLGLGGRKAGRPNPQVERESWRLLASLERLDSGQRARFGDELLPRVRREPRSASWLWAIGRLGARTPLYGPLNSVVAPAAAERWIDALLALKELTPEAAAAVAQIGGRTGDPARDVPEEAAERAAARLEEAGFSDIAERLRRIVPPDRSDASRVFGEGLPEGLRLGGLEE